MNYKEQFINWDSPNSLTIKTRKAYASELERIDESFPPIKSLHLNKPIFEYDDCDELTNLISSIVELDGFPEFNIKHGNYVITAALHKYEQFLREKDTIITWYPALTDYDPGITKEQWLSLMGNNNIFNTDAFVALARMYDYGGAATCTQLAEQYGSTDSFYRNTLVAQLGSKAKEALNLPYFVNAKGETRVWPILFIGRKATAEEHGSYVWKMRPELYDACTEFEIWKHLTVSAVEVDPKVGEDVTKYETVPPLSGGTNTILYGVPGCGKSYTIAHEYCNDADRVVRVVFHPDYTNSDFIGQILPKVKDGNVSYEFIPGPFTAILKEAVANPGKKYVLVIEEINRGNAPAIFGEVFQLLDRVATDTDDKLAGTSEYGIRNADIAKAVYGSAEAEVLLPPNLWLVATMNTADQNVFTLDTAFKRRWKMRCIRNSFAKCSFAKANICKTSVTWETFVTVINQKIVDSNLATVSSEDKRLGAFFVHAEELADSSAFAEKVLAYLWDDAFKYNRADVFRSDLTTLEDLVDAFATAKMGVFADTLRAELKVTITEPEMTEETEAGEES